MESGLAQCRNECVPRRVKDRRVELANGSDRISTVADNAYQS